MERVTKSTGSIESSFSLWLTGIFFDDSSLWIPFSANFRWICSLIVLGERRWRSIIRRNWTKSRWSWRKSSENQSYHNIHPMELIRVHGEIPWSRVRWWVDEAIHWICRGTYLFRISSWSEIRIHTWEKTRTVFQTNLENGKEILHQSQCWAFFYSKNRSIPEKWRRENNRLWKFYWKNDWNCGTYTVSQLSNERPIPKINKEQWKSRSPTKIEQEKKFAFDIRE